MENIKTALASVGGSLEHVVKLTSYLTNLEANSAEFREVCEGPASDSARTTPARAARRRD